MFILVTYFCPHGAHAPDSRCSSCKVTGYCSREHQPSDWASHKTICNDIKCSRAKMEKVERKLRTLPGNSASSLGNPFETSFGHFGSTVCTRPYMVARITYAVQLLSSNSHDAAAIALEISRGSLDLCRRDLLGARSAMPNLYLRLGQDQKCYDFIKGWEDMSVPFLNSENEDIMEGVSMFCGRRLIAPYSLAVALIKVRMLLDLREVRASSVLLGVDKINVDILQHIRENMDLRSSICDKIETLEHQTDQLFAAIHKANKYLWRAIVGPGDSLPLMDWEGNVEVAAVLSLSDGKCWEETNGAFRWIQKKL
ncbi:hypothetical protein FA13DRAFT_1757244 [Coprinellus micaceus]|uniref:MYND-type domain-containing protein n=1 Tax=Coprinellus micaceus TaxID=71717 RepID=A0A4Y7SLC1_COPMI|nr:hypothetical protein FA13DRAFT_1757244 [Coprinellus micaceus]